MLYGNGNGNTNCDANTKKTQINETKLIKRRAKRSNTRRINATRTTHERHLFTERQHSKRQPRIDQTKKHGATTYQLVESTKIQTKISKFTLSKFAKLV